MDLDEGTSFSYLRIGKCYEKLGNNKEALKYFNQTVKEDPLLDKGWLALTDLYIKNKNFQKALFFINRAINIDEKNPAYWIKYADINLKLNLFEESSKGLQNCLDLENYTLEVFVALTDVLHYLGDFTDAINILLKAQGYYEDFVEIEYRLAGLYLLTQEETLGLAILENALKINYDHHSIIKELYPSVLGLDSVKDLLHRTKD